MNTTRRSALAVIGLSLLAASLPGMAQDKWPARTITYVAAFPPGGNTDTLARLIAPKLGAALGQQVIVENRGGAGGSVGSAYVARQPADGYTLLGGTISSHAINQSLYPNIGYDSIKSFEPVAMLGMIPNLILVRADSPYKTIQDLITAAKAKKQITSGSPGSGTSPHMALELMKQSLGIDITHVPYKGGGPALQDLLGGQIDMMIETTIVGGPHIQQGKLRALATTASTRVPTMPNVPTLAEAGAPGYDVQSWQAVFAPAGTPKPIVERLHNEIMKALAEPELQDRLSKMGLNNPKMTIDQFNKFQREEVAKWAAVVKKGNIKVD
ncbi:Bug family tripartite tricarboxylate transporter substrate binding protein [Noviherbaspirillum aerium]|uniref:Bug family tripartite tricarboxylate transporter substrate binding protein n=1 Tax=Noviherbaspirillum aerium TaxID=2588497 RepID=UPI00124E4462|nr:tripartite tricarboxylate transporter substrate binding protein [Noviherbaspirillum aerium]